MKNRHLKLLLALIFSLAILLAACKTQASTVQEFGSIPLTEQETPETTTRKQREDTQETYPNMWTEEVPSIDDQGAVAVEIVPLNLNSPGHTLDFRVALNTHSVDLSMDLAALATLETDTGLSVQAELWDAPRGGHHVRGTLSFPAEVDGKAVLEGASKMTIWLVDVDAPERVFVWER